MDPIYTSDSFIEEIKKHHEQHRKDELGDINAYFPDEHWEYRNGITLQNCILSVEDYNKIKEGKLELREESKVIYDLINIYYLYNDFLVDWGDLTVYKLSPMEILHRFGFETPVSMYFKLENSNDYADFVPLRIFNNTIKDKNYFYRISPIMYYLQKKFSNICKYNPEKSWIRNFNHRANQIQRVINTKHSVIVDDGNNKYSYEIPELSKHNKNIFIYSLAYMNKWIKCQPVKWLYPFGQLFEIAISQRLECDRIQYKRDNGTWTASQLVVNADCNPCAIDRAVNYWYLICAAYYYHDIKTVREYINLNSDNIGRCCSSWGVNSNMNTNLKYGDRLFHAEL